MASEAETLVLDGQPIVTKPPPWHTSVTLDLTLAAISSGTFIVAAILYEVSPFHFGIVSIGAMVVAFAVEVLDLLCLVIDLGDPRRFLNMLRMFKLVSPMSLGVWLSSGLAFFEFVTSMLGWFLIRGHPELIVWIRIAAGLGFPFAFGVATYKGVLLSTTAQPVWSKLRWLGGVFSLSAGACGAVTALGVAVFFGDGPAMVMLRLIAAFILAACTVAVFLTMRPINRVMRPRVGRSLVLWNLLAVYVGAAIPAILCFLPSFGRMDYLIITMVLAGALALRHVLIMLPHALSNEGRVPGEL